MRTSSSAVHSRSRACAVSSMPSARRARCRRSSKPAAVEQRRPSLHQLGEARALDAEGRLEQRAALPLELRHAARDVEREGDLGDGELQALDAQPAVEGARPQQQQAAAVADLDLEVRAARSWACLRRAASAARTSWARAGAALAATWRCRRRVIAARRRRASRGARRSPGAASGLGSALASSKFCMSMRPRKAAPSLMMILRRRQIADHAAVGRDLDALLGGDVADEHAADRAPT